ncbi:MAG: host specificity factor TipJ family phage tail protein [Xanthobacteraceae bacterium]
MRHETVKDGEPVGLLALPHIDPTRGRKRLDVAYGMTLAEMAVVALPGVAMDRVRVSIGEHVIDRAIWHRVRPHHGATVIIRAVPGDDTLRSVLSVAVLVAAVALGQFYAPAIAGSVLGSAFPAGLTGYGALAASAGTISTIGSLATAGFAVAGSLLLNALIPVRGLGDQDKGTDIYAITGLKNSANPGGVIPSILGKHRYAPPYAATPFTEIIGDDQYVTAAFLFGHGPLSITDQKLGDTPIGQYNDIQVELFDGSTMPNSTLYSRQVIEEQIAVNLTYANGAQYRTTARDATACSIDITFVQGLVRFNDDGDPGWWTVQIEIYQRNVNSSTWTHVAAVDLSGDAQKITRRTYGWAFPERGQYEILVYRVTGDTGDPKVMDRSDWSCLRSFRPESPFNYKKPVAMAVVRIRASGQLNGVVDNYNAVAQIVCPDWDSGSQTWITRTTQNPASLFRHVLQGPANAYPKTDDEIDLTKLQQWHEFCASKGLKYNRVHDYDATRLDVLGDIAAAGRATPHDDGERWSVTIDTAQATYVSAITPRNSWEFQGTTPQVSFPDGHRVQFIDETNGYNQAERIIPFPGIEPAHVEVTEDLPLPGVTDPSLIWKEARRRQYELIHRPHTYSVSQDIESLVLARGDLTRLNQDVLDRNHVAARIRSVSGQVVTLDTPISLEAGRSYAVAVRKSDGTSIRRTIVTVDGETYSLQLIGDIAGIATDDLAMVGLSVAGPALDVIVKSVERGDNMTAKLTLVDAAPQIEELVDAEVPPTWSGRVGEVVDISGLLPAVPTFTVSDAELVFNVALSPGPAGANIGATAYYIVSYRLHGGGAFTTVNVPIATGVARIDGFAVGDEIDVKARAFTSYNVGSAETDIAQATLHAAAPNEPSADNDGYTADTIAFTVDHF